MAPSSAVSPVQEPTPQKSALIVGSSPRVNKMLSRVLTREGWEIHRAVDHRTVLPLVQARPYDLIITIESALGSEDVELLREIRSVRSHVRLIILVDEWTRGDVIAAIREGAFSYFCAPFEPGLLAIMLRDAVIEPAWDDGIELLEAAPEWVSLAVRCDRVTADRLVQFVRGVGGIPLAERDDIAYAFQEILLNAMEHGTNFDPSHYVEIGGIWSKRAVTLRVKDPGQGFSLDELRHAAVNKPREQFFDHLAVREQQGLRFGGFGIMLAKALVDEIIYSEDGNDVLLVKYLDSPAQGSASATHSQ